MYKKDIIVIGAGASGMMCAIESGKRGRSVLVLDHADIIGKKIRISGGGSCNFTNTSISHANYISNNPHFCKSALSRFSPRDFIAMLEKHGVRYEEREQGQFSILRRIIDTIVTCYTGKLLVVFKLRLEFALHPLKSVSKAGFSMRRYEF